MGRITNLKIEIIKTLLTDEDYILIVVNPKYPGVKLPEYLMDLDKPIPLNIGYRMPVPVPDLSVNSDGISGTLSFNRSPFSCFFPFGAILQLSVGEEHLIWIVPDELLDNSPTTEEPPPRPKRPTLKLVD